MIYRINLQLFARGAGGEDRTEKATPKKRREARKGPGIPEQGNNHDHGGPSRFHFHKSLWNQYL